MKRVLFVGFTLVVSMLFSSCLFGDEDIYVNPLVNTTWESVYRDEIRIMKFSEETIEVEMGSVSSGTFGVYGGSGTYIYNSPNITIRLDGVVVSGRIDNDIMDLGYDFVFVQM